MQVAQDTAALNPKEEFDAVSLQPPVQAFAPEVDVQVLVFFCARDAVVTDLVPVALACKRHKGELLQI